MVYIIVIDLFGGVYECVARCLCLEWGLNINVNVHVTYM